MMKAELEVMTEQKSGSIVNNLSLFATKLMPTAPAYTVSKHAVKTLQQLAAANVAGSQVRINSVSPGFTRPSEALDTYLDSNPDAEAVFRSPQGRMYDATKDVYPALAYFFDDVSKGVTGQ